MSLLLNQQGERLDLGGVPFVWLEEIAMHYGWKPPSGDLARVDHLSAQEATAVAEALSRAGPKAESPRLAQFISFCRQGGFEVQ